MPEALHLFHKGKEDAVMKEVKSPKRPLIYYYCIL